jgi:uncharacterized small protein (DUF1192 family)
MHGDDEEKPVKQQVLPANIDEFSIEALHGYIATLEAEIERVRAAIAERQRAREGAAALFRKQVERS